MLDENFRDNFWTLPLFIVVTWLHAKNQDAKLVFLLMALLIANDMKCSDFMN
jgi:hypothetical protein